MPDSRPFRVIVVGGGVGGLAASHALQKANIDHVVLEKGEIAPAKGSSIGMHPHGSRILEQFGVLEEMEKECNPVGKYISILPDGRTFGSSGVFQISREIHGYPIPVLERRRFLEILYEKLPDKSMVKAGVGLVDLIDTEDNVKAILTDGTVEEGDLVIGCDGVHSLTRSLMWRNANAAIPGYITTTEKKSLFTERTALLGMTPTLPGMSNCDITVTFYEGKSCLVLSQKKYQFWFIFFRNEKRHYWPTSPRWTEADAEKRAAECLDCPVSNTHVFGELWKQRVRSELINIEEGLFEHMFFGRVALAGDAVHKMTPNMGYGGNSSIESITVLINLINRAVKDHEARGTKPDKAAIEAILQEYQDARKTRMQGIVDFSHFATKMESWENLGFKMVSRILPYIPDRWVAMYVSKVIASAPKVDFIPAPRDAKAVIPWIGSLTGPSEQQKSGAFMKTAGNLLSIVSVLLLSSFAYYYL